MVLAVLFLSTLAVLSYVMAQNDDKLTQRSIKTTQSYYAAHAKAQENIFQIESAVATGQTQPADLQKINPAIILQGDQIKFEVEIDSARLLRVGLEIFEGSVKIVRYQVENTAKWDNSEPIKVWEGQ